MRVVNAIIFVTPFLISAVLTYLISVHSFIAILSYLVLLGMVVGAFTFAVFLKHYIASRRYAVSLIDRYAEYKVAVVIPTYNEDPELVRDTALSALLALKGRGDVFILDDSTEENVKKEINTLEEIGVRVFRRGTRRGYKAGAINDFLKAYGNNYDLLAIFDADQRPVSTFFDEVLHYFSDERVAFVQVPQAYTELETGISVGSYWQQQPFLRIVMRGRKNSAFSLGSGTVFRIKALEEVGGLDEETITEDIATSVDLHARGWKSIYVDKPLVWYGEPPKDLRAYLIQQSRWSLGGFQLLPKLLKANLSVSAFLDYIAGWMYWLKEGPLTVVELIAPAVFLLLNMPFIGMNAILYILAYIPFFFSTLVVFIVAAREFYGFKGFVYHQTVELLAFPAITASFITWLLKKRKPFAVTPKKAGKVQFRVILPYLVVLVVLMASVVKGSIYLLKFDYSQFYYATLINTFWATYFVPFLIFGVYITIFKALRGKPKGKGD
ncbi:MAG TPA: glycosyltransferase [Archaeoglobus profundus]|nr:glycosyltransferase [Archaeoglobus profundus]